MADQTRTWSLIHAERAALADLLDTLTPQQWAATSLCTGWTVQLAAAHVVAGAEQTTPTFLARFAVSGFRFDRMIDRDAHRLGVLAPDEIVARLRARTSTTNHAAAPVPAMLGEVVVHTLDIRGPLGLPAATPPEAAAACLALFTSTSFPVGGKARARGLRLAATDAPWSSGEGPEVTGPAAALLLAVTGRPAGTDGLSGDGVPVLRSRLAPGTGAPV